MEITYPINEPNFAERNPVRCQRVAQRRHFRFVAKHELSRRHRHNWLRLVPSYHQVGGHAHKEILVGCHLCYALWNAR